MYRQMNWTQEQKDAKESLQPDQQPLRWDRHVGLYEEVFEPLTDQFANEALDRLALDHGSRLIDIGAGSGGAALLAAARDLAVAAIDASPAMVARIAERAAHRRLPADKVSPQLMDGAALALPNNIFDAALSVFGVVLFPDALQGLREAFRVLRPGGRIAIVTWTQPEKYELAARLMRAAATVVGEPIRPPTLPAQLRFRDEPAFRALFRDAGFEPAEIVVSTKTWPLPSARWIADRIAFAPGMAAMVEGYGRRREQVIEAFVSQTELELGRGEISLSATAFIGLAGKPTT